MATEDGRVGKPTGLSQVEPASSLAPSGSDPSRVRNWLVSMTKQGEDRIWRGAETALKAFDVLFEEAMLSGDLVIAVRDTTKATLGGNCTFADDDVRLLARLAAIAVDAGLHLGVITDRRTVQNMETARKRRRDSDGSPKGGDGEAGSVRSTTARAEGIAKDTPSTGAHPNAD